MGEILYKELSYRVIGAAMEVHRVLGPGYLEAVYQMALCHEMHLRGISFKHDRRLPVRYKEVIVGEYEADVIVEDKMILELKATGHLHPKHEAQAVHYLAATGFELAILLNFGSASLDYKRLIRERNR